MFEVKIAKSKRYPIEQPIDSDTFGRTEVTLEVNPWPDEKLLTELRLSLSSGTRGIGSIESEKWGFNDENPPYLLFNWTSDENVIEINREKVENILRRLSKG